VAGPFTWRCDEIWRTRNYGIARIDMDAPSIKLELES
jgi:hypothetical protein